MSPREAESRFRNGDISAYEFAKFSIAWLWTESRENPRHDMAYRRLGPLKYWRRIERARSRCGLNPLYHKRIAELEAK